VPELPPPQVCLSPPYYPEDDPRYMRRGLRFGVESGIDAMPQLTGASRPFAIGPGVSALANFGISRTVDLRLGVVATVAGSIRGVVAPLGLRLGLAFAWSCDYDACFATVLGATVGALAIARDAGGVGDPQPRTSLWIHPDLAPVAYRWGRLRQFELALRFGLGFAGAREVEATSFGPAYATVGVWLGWISMPVRSPYRDEIAWVRP
jgi:hypothetical protein